MGYTEVRESALLPVSSMSYQEPGMSLLTCPVCIFGVNKSPVKTLGFVFHAGVCFWVINMTHQMASV